MFFLMQIILIVLPCNMAAVQNLYSVSKAREAYLVTKGNTLQS